MKKLILLLLILTVFVGLTCIAFSAKDTLPPNPSWTWDCDGNVEGIVEDMPINYDRSKLKSIVLDSANSYNYILSYEEFIPGKKFWCKWFAHVEDIKKDAQATIIFTDMAGNDTTIKIFFYSYKLTIRPSLDFGTVSLGQVIEMDCWLVNEDYIPDTIINVSLKYQEQGFEVNSTTYPFILTPHDSVRISVSFRAAMVGNYFDSVGVISICGCYMRYFNSVKATVNAPKIEVTSCNFGDVEVYNYKSAMVSINNKSDAELLISDYKPPNNSINFSSDLWSFTEYPISVRAWESVSFQVNFFPTEEKEYKDSIIFISNTIKEGAIDSIVELTGRGIILEDVNNLNNEYDIKLYPNPADDILSINFNLDTRIPDFVRLFDYYGNVVYENRNIDLQNLKIRTSELASGMYMLLIGNGSEMMKRKVVVVH
ncbi:MAG: hypothetical protein A2X61_12775 [Ignavibacteria bacterium GWB2_35_12]|nr:MAG: hypothetical protein A2X61_12775 [Ignavibacteria bacterium GWB2_35_12]OGU92987.1 MAG: hypothetical protein A2220_15700 [Ignavibacteria bacterium RIFOXYA2_FULL_35_10]OGV22973.1 MAG: hypothetical protein A2475_10245 [Ignavibacteria bacterium RIFOXYC2_FULL_35_21]